MLCLQAGSPLFGKICGKKQPFKVGLRLSKVCELERRELLERFLTAITTSGPPIPVQSQDPHGSDILGNHPWCKRVSHDFVVAKQDTVPLGQH